MRKKSSPRNGSAVLCVVSSSRKSFESEQRNWFAFWFVLFSSWQKFTIGSNTFPLPVAKACFQTLSCSSVVFHVMSRIYHFIWLSPPITSAKDVIVIHILSNPRGNFAVCIVFHFLSSSSSSSSYAFQYPASWHCYCQSNTDCIDDTIGMRPTNHIVLRTLAKYIVEHLMKCFWANILF